MELLKTKEILEENGYTCEEVETLKGSCLVKGLTIGSGQIKPTIYATTVENIETEADIINMVENVLSRQPEVDLDVILDGDFILDHVISCIRHETDDNKAVKWSVMGDLEEYIRINLGSDGYGSTMTVVVSQQMLDSAHLDKDQVRTAAREHLREQATIQTMQSVLAGIMGDCDDIVSDDMAMFVASTISKMDGAAVAFLLPDLLYELCSARGYKGLHIIPSSRHEALLVPDTMDAEEINRMIVEINETTVNPTDVLSSHTYHYEAVA